MACTVRNNGDHRYEITLISRYLVDINILVTLESNNEDKR